MKKFLNFCLLFVFILGAGVLFVACGGEENNPPPEPPPPEDLTYTVNVRVNNTDYGSIINDNLKTEYDYGEEINIRVVPNEGYFLEGYSDEPENNSLTRTIVVTKNMDITVNLREGTEFTFYGYKVRLYGSEKPWNSESSGGGVSRVITQKQSVYSGYLSLICRDYKNFGCYVLKQGDKERMFSREITKTSDDRFTFSKAQFDTIFEENKEEYIDIHKYNTFVGYAFTQIKTDDDDPYYKIPIGMFNENDVHCKLNYLYVLDGTTHNKGFVKNSENQYTDTHLTGYLDSITFNQYRLFTYNGRLYYFQNLKDKHVGNTQDWSVSWTLDEQEFNVVFKAPQSN